MLGCCPNGTVTVDWGDGTTPDVLTGTSTSTAQWTPTHNYAAAGDYVVTLTVDGEMGFYGSKTSDEYSGILRRSPSADSGNYCYLTSVKKIEVGDGMTSIGSYAFGYCYSLASIKIPDSVTSIGSYAFKNCSSLASITIPDGATSIESYAFQNCSSLASAKIPDSVTSIAGQAFGYCYSLARFTIPYGVKKLENYSFYSCYSLASITIPARVTNIGNSTFQYCYSLRNIRFESAKPPSALTRQAFGGLPTDCVISVPVGSLAAYTSATNYPDPATYTYIEED
jgi:hypothetical protein